MGIWYLVILLSLIHLFEELEPIYARLLEMMLISILL